MASLTPKRTLKSAAIVFSFWIFIFFISYFDGQNDLRFFLVVLVFLLVGAFISSGESKSFRNQTYEYLSPKERMGLHCTLGPVPVHVKLDLDELRSDGSAINSHYPDEIAELGYNLIEDYQTKYGNSHPAHVTLFEDVLMVLCSEQYVNLSATYLIDATGRERIANTDANFHGNRSLLSHSLMVASISMLEAQSYCEEFTHEKPKRAVDPKFKPNPNDPLIGLLGLAHDLGKLISLRLEQSKDGQAITVKVNKNHDQLGAVLISRLPSFWSSAISAADRSILQNVMSIYHHPQDLPIVPAKEGGGGEKNVSDREVALLLLLIKADRMAGSIERGMSYKAAHTETSEFKLPDIKSEFTGWTQAFLNYVAVNKLFGGNGGRSIAFKTMIKDRHYLIFDEKMFFEDFVTFLKRPDFLELRPPGNNPNPIISNLLQNLDSLEVLYRPDTKSLSGRAPELSVYKVEFFDPDKDLNTPSLILSSAFTLDISEWDEMAQFKTAKNCHSNPIFGHCRFGSRGKKHRASTNDDVLNEELMGSPPKEIGVSLASIIKTDKKGKDKQK